MSPPEVISGWLTSDRFSTSSKPLVAPGYYARWHEGAAVSIPSGFPEMRHDHPLYVGIAQLSLVGCIQGAPA